PRQLSDGHPEAGKVPLRHRGQATGATLNVSLQWQDWVARARNVRVEDVMRRNGYTLRKKGKQLCGKCQLSRGDDLGDLFWVSVNLNKWGCRGCELKSRDVIDLTRRLGRSEFVDAFEKLTGERRPRGNSRANGHAKESEGKRVTIETYD